MAKASCFMPQSKFHSLLRSLATWVDSRERLEPRGQRRDFFSPRPFQQPEQMALSLRPASMAKSKRKKVNRSAIDFGQLIQNFDSRSRYTFVSYVSVVGGCTHCYYHAAVYTDKCALSSRQGGIFFPPCAGCFPPLLVTSDRNRRKGRRKRGRKEGGSSAAAVRWSQTSLPFSVGRLSRVSSTFLHWHRNTGFT